MGKKNGNGKTNGHTPKIVHWDDMDPEDQQIALGKSLALMRSISEGPPFPAIAYGEEWQVAHHHDGRFEMTLKPDALRKEQQKWER